MPHTILWQAVDGSHACGKCARSAAHAEELLGLSVRPRGGVEVLAAECDVCERVLWDVYSPGDWPSGPWPSTPK